MAAVNKTPYRGNVFGGEPVIQSLLVAAGSSQAIKMGEICYLDVNTDNVTPVTGTTDNLHAIVIANEEQLAADAARFLEFIVPKHGDIFEFALDAATVLKWGDELQIHSATSSQTLAASTTDAVAWAVDVNTPASGTTWPTVSTVRCMFKLANKASAGKELPFIGADFGDAS